MADQVRVTVGGQEKSAMLVSSIGSSGTGADQVQGNIAASATDSGNPVKVGGIYSSTLPTLTDGQRGNLQVGSRGSVSVQIMGPDSANAVAFSSAGADGISNTLSLIGVFARPQMYNGTSWDRQRKASTFARVESSAASGNPATLKASAGDVMKWWGLNGASTTYLQLYNKATTPVIGTDTPALTFPILGYGIFDCSIPNGGAYFSNGISYAFTTDAAGTTAADAAAVTAFSLLVA